MFRPTKEEIALDRWSRAPDRRIVCTYRRLRRWIGLGCRTIPWGDALPVFTCSRSRWHSGLHVAKTLNGPISWNEESQWSVPPHEGLVCSPSKKEFELIGMLRDPSDPFNQEKIRRVRLK